MLGSMFEVFSLVSMAIPLSSKPTIYIHRYEKNIQESVGCIYLNPNLSPLTSL
jgi:hypothetical protein